MPNKQTVILENLRPEIDYRAEELLRQARMKHKIAKFNLRRLVQIHV